MSENYTVEENSDGYVLEVENPGREREEMVESVIDLGFDPLSRDPVGDHTSLWVEDRDGNLIGEAYVEDDRVEVHVYGEDVPEDYELAGIAATLRGESSMAEGFFEDEDLLEDLEGEFDDLVLDVDGDEWWNDYGVPTGGSPG
ncbi:MAG: hypothetical protein ABEK01_02685 [Candidatus Nanohaloarchaea archaeon]